MSRIGRLVERMRVRAGAAVVDNTFQLMAKLGRMHPNAKPDKHGVEVIRDLRYHPGGLTEHLLDVYKPTGAGPFPVVLYVHGGGFRILSKDTHWIMALAFARAGYVVFNASYRLAPRHPYPAAIEDACRAYSWVVANAARHGGDAARLAVAGESAGANLATSLAIAACMRRPEPWAQQVFDTGVTPVAVLPACGMLQVSDPGRIKRRRRLSTFMSDRLQEVTDAYLRKLDPHAPGGSQLADPLLILESDAVFERPLPPFYASVGTRDPLLDDTRRLKAALDRRKVLCQASYFPGEVHAFHAMVWRPEAIRHWTETLKFLRACLSTASAQAVG